jgi:hypothetical protein
LDIIYPVIRSRNGRQTTSTIKASRSLSRMLLKLPRMAPLRILLVCLSHLLPESVLNVVPPWRRRLHKALWYASTAMSERMPIMSMITKFDEHVADIQIQSSSSRSIVTSKTSITSTTANMPRTRDGYDFCMAAMDESHNYPRVSIRTKRKISWARCLNCVDQCGSFNGMEK